MTSPRDFESCCLKSFNWAGTPSGHEAKLAHNPTYVTGSNSEAAVLFVHDGLGWSGETLDFSQIKAGKSAELDMEGFKARNNRSVRKPKVFAYVKALRDSRYKKIGAAGYCWDGWPVLRLATEKLVDCVICVYPSMITEADFDGVDVLIMFLQPEHDSFFPDEMKLYAFRKFVLDKKSLLVERVHFPGK
ncbi:hypothetical protein G6011_03674 [Alternaria panax]|uniref:Dienelactone hydrolase domain-containing protein n=1 Tax=Alternaria panax TaxID=48097 RepID=A0AAD4IFK6_9PLEO|nr:hypothetical protein G6011_03674 [Alternaria panax]